MNENHQLFAYGPDLFNDNDVEIQVKTTHTNEYNSLALNYIINTSIFRDSKVVIYDLSYYWIGSEVLDQFRLLKNSDRFTVVILSPLRQYRNRWVTVALAMLLARWATVTRLRYWRKSESQYFFLLSKNDPRFEKVWFFLFFWLIFYVTTFSISCTFLKSFFDFVNYFLIKGIRGRYLNLKTLFSTFWSKTFFWDYILPWKWLK